MAKQFSFDVSDEDHALLTRLRANGFEIRLDLSPDDGGVDVTKNGKGLQWSFISEIDCTDGEVYEDHDEAIEAILDNDVDDD